MYSKVTHTGIQELIIKPFKINYLNYIILTKQETEDRYIPEKQFGQKRAP